MIMVVTIVVVVIVVVVIMVVMVMVILSLYHRLLLSRSIVAGALDLSS